MDLSPRLAALLLLALAALQANAQGVEEAEDEPWVATFHQIYDTNRDTAHLEPAKTLELLKQLELELAKDRYGHVDNMAFAVGRVQALIDVSRLSESKCSAKAFDDLAGTVQAHEHAYWNVLAYLRHFRRQQLLLCKPQLDKQLVEADDKLSEAEQVEVGKLVRSIKEARHLNSQERIDGLKAYMEGRLGQPMSAYKNEREKFIEAYEQSAKPVCQKVVEEFGEPMGVYDSLADEPEAYEGLDKLTATWVENYQVCNKLLKDMDQLIKSPSRLLISLINKPMKRSP